MIWKEVIIVQFQYMQAFACRDRARSCKRQSGKPFSWLKFDIRSFRILRNAAYWTPKLRNLFLAEKFAISYWEEEHKLYAAQGKLLSKYWDKNRGATARVDNALKIKINTIRQSITQHLFYIQWYICQGDMFRPSRSNKKSPDIYTIAYKINAVLMTDV